MPDCAENHGQATAGRHMAHNGTLKETHMTAHLNIT